MGREHIKVAKFGGSSLADAAHFQKVREIVEADPERRYIVPSAPGKRSPRDEKVTDLLYLCYEEAKHGHPYKKLLEKIKERYKEICRDLSMDFFLESDFGKIEAAFLEHAGAEYAASRGEYLNGKLLAAYLGYEFVDAAEVVRFGKDGRFEDERTNFFLGQKLSRLERAVIPGFYGADDAGNIHTFSRGGSDVTGAIVARAVLADLYENWTDVSGFLLADPGIISHPRKIDVMTFEELNAVFDAKRIDPTECEEEITPDATSYGRRFSASGGVAQSVIKAAAENGCMDIKAKPCSGVKECKVALAMLKVGKLPEDIIEGMACEGGCIAGPGSIATLQQLKAARMKKIKGKDGDSITDMLTNMEANDVDMVRTSFDMPEK